MVGAVVSTVQVTVAGVGSVAPFDVAATLNVWDPCASPVYPFGLVHDVRATPSSPHLNVDPDLVEWKVNVAAELAVGLAGALSMIVFGAAAASTPPPGNNDATMLAAMAATRTSRWRIRPRRIPIIATTLILGARHIFRFRGVEGQ